MCKERELLEKLGEWRSLSLSARDTTSNPVKFIELTGQINGIDAMSALVRALCEDCNNKKLEETVEEL